MLQVGPEKAASFQLLDTGDEKLGHFHGSRNGLWLQVDLTKYNLPNYMGIVTYKTAYYSFYLPVACGLILAGRADPVNLQLAQDICLQMGQYFQVRRPSHEGDAFFWKRHISESGHLLTHHALKCSQMAVNRHFNLEVSSACQYKDHKPTSEGTIFEW